MKTFLFPSCLVAAVCVSGSLLAPAQSLPKEQPKMLTVVREKVKVGRAAEHARHEAGWPAAFEKAKSTDYYLAVTSMTGPSEAWYLIPRESHAAEAEAMKREDKDPELAAELARLAERDAEFVESVSVIQAVARPDLTVGDFPDLSKARFFQIGVYSVRPGKGEEFDALAKLYGKIRLRAAPKSSYRVYSVLAGMPTPAYLIISSVENYGDFDQMLKDDLSTGAAVTAAERAEFAAFSEIVVKEEFHRYRLDPGQSYVAKEVREKDPGFWMRK
jgi:hypothetical protein